MIGAVILSLATLAFVLIGSGTSFALVGAAMLVCGTAARVLGQMTELLDTHHPQHGSDSGDRHG